VAKAAAVVGYDPYLSWIEPHGFAFTHSKDLP
jgi:hypothetical protein